MLKWIAKLMGGASFDIPATVPEAWVQRMELLLSPPESTNSPRLQRPGLAHDLLGFVLQGEPLAVLAEVAQNDVAAQYLGLWGHAYNLTDGAPDIYEHFNAVPASIALRWARVLAACASTRKGYCAFQMANGVIWPELLLAHSGGRSFYGSSGQRIRALHVSAEQMEALLQEDGLAADSLLVAAFDTPVRVTYSNEQKLQMVTDLVGFPDALERHLESIRPHLLPSAVPQRLHALNMLAKASTSTLDQLAPQLGELATASSKQVRQAAEALVRRCGAAAHTALRQIATEGKPEQRANALALIYKLALARGDDAAVAWASQTASADKAPTVLALIDEWAHALSTRASEEATHAYTVPIIDWSPQVNGVPAALLQNFWLEVAESVSRSNARVREIHARMLALGHPSTFKEFSGHTPADMEALQRHLESELIQPPQHASQGRRELQQHVYEGLVKLAPTTEVTPVALLKMLSFFDLATTADSSLTSAARTVFNTQHQRTGHPTLLELSVMLDESGSQGRGLLRNYCESWGLPFASDWPDADVWPFFAHHVDWLVEVLADDTIKGFSFDRKGLFRAIATMPAPPAAAVNLLFTLALGSGKSDRLLAQEALRHQAGKEARLIEALSDGKAEVRMLAAQWLGRLRHEPAVPALEKAVLREKHDLAKGAMLDVLQLMGQPIEKYLDRGALAAEAAKSLAKGIPKDIDWFPWNALPEVHWADGAGPVPPDVLKWLLVQAVKQKQPEPNAVLRKYCGMLDPVGREAWGQCVLEAWLREDVRPISPEDAVAQARSSAQVSHQSMAQFPQYYQNDPKQGLSVEQLTAAYLPAFLRQPAGSAVGSKGLLAVVAACAAERAAGPTQRYLKEWYGSRASQGKALIAMLAWIEHPSATQLMLAIGSRFRTRSFQEEATRQAQALAERKGWTLAELADRTVPSAGFDDDGTLELSYGPRSFTARLMPDFKVELFGPEGRKLAALPEPRLDDDGEAAKQSKKTFSAAKKELKSIVALQTDRLYEALCIERAWPYADWAAYLLAHPVLRHLVQRLVWVQVAEGQVVQAFRPLDDGTLSDREDNAVVVPDEACVRLAHDSLLTSDEVRAWQQHLVDYEIKPLFQQLGKGTYALPAGEAHADAVADFNGHLLEAFSLRNRALKLGYVRGPAEDGGWFHVYEKRFPTMGLQAVIRFTGNGLPEANRTVALLNLSFTPSQAAGTWQPEKLLLSKVPAVLLSECYNDMRLIASEGPGFDADWQKKSEY